MKRKRDRVFETPWFQLIAENTTSDSPYYYIDTYDYVVTLATTAGGDFLLVEQFRAPVAGKTLEFPAGHIEKGEDPKTAARRELLEETGYDSNDIELLGPAANPDTGRLSNKLWCFHAKHCFQTRELEKDHPEGIKLHLKSPMQISEMILSGHFNHALNLTPLFYALFNQRLTLPRGHNDL